MRKSILAVIVMLGVASTAGASTITLDYTGNSFTSFYAFGSLPSDVYTSTGSVSGVIELLAPLGANLVGGFVTPVSFSFSDGVNTLANADATSIASRASTSFEFWTDGSGQIGNWAVNVIDFSPGIFRSTVQTLNLPGTWGTDSGTSTLCGPVVACIDTAANLNIDPLYSQSGRVDGLPGVWTAAPAPVPEPTTLLLLGSGLAAVIARRRCGDWSQVAP